MRNKATSEEVLREPLLAPVLALALGILIQHAWPGTLIPLVFFSGTVLLLCGLALFRHFRLAAASSCLLGFVLCGSLLEIVHNPAQSPKLDVPDLSQTILEGCVVEAPALLGDREQFTLELGPHARARVSMYAHDGEPLPQLHYGQRVETEGRIRTPRNFGNPDSFDFRNYLARQDIFWSLSSLRVTSLPGTCGDWFHRTISSIRMSALGRIADLYHGDPYNTAMMDAVLIGEGSGLDRLWTEQYRATGTFHALIISGSHVAVLAGAFLFLLRLCFVPRGIATLLTVAAAWLYAFVTGWQAPVIRSAAGMSLFAIGSLCYRDRRLLNLLAAVALFFLVLDPGQLFDASFQLSFLAVAFLALFAVPLIERTTQPLAEAAHNLGDLGRDPRLAPAVSAHRVELRLLAATLSAALPVPLPWSERAICLLARLGVFFADLFVTSAVIQAGLALPMAIYFHRVSFTGLSANAVVVPLLGLVVPLGFLALFTGFHWVAGLAALLLDLSRRTVAWHAGFEPNWRIPSPPLLLSLAICLALAFVAVRWRFFLARWLSVGALASLLIVLVWSPFAPHVTPRVLELTAIDVGQGDALFVGFPDGKTMMVDAGGIPKFKRRDPENATPARLDIGEDVVAPYLWWRAIRNIDVLAISHLHDDHVGGVPAILNDFHVRELWVGATPPCATWDLIQAKAKERGTRIRRLQRGERWNFGGTTIEVLEPAPDYAPGPGPGNNDSVVMRIAYGERSVLLTGDMEKALEWEYAAIAHWPHADILKVGHHGSKSSSTSEFLDQVRPALALISDGYGNLYGHPHKVTLDSLGQRHIATYRTDRDGLLTFMTDGHQIWRE